MTNNVEQAVLTSDCIVVFSSNWSRLASEIKVDLQYPRDRLDPPTWRHPLCPYDPTYRNTSTSGEGIPGSGVSLVPNYILTNALETPLPSFDTGSDDPSTHTTRSLALAALSGLPAHRHPQPHTFAWVAMPAV
jgi:hypothetical protein